MSKLGEVLGRRRLVWQAPVVKGDTPSSPTVIRLLFPDREPGLVEGFVFDWARECLMEVGGGYGVESSGLGLW